MTKFEKTKKALEDKTRNTWNYITITKNTDARHRGNKYAIKNVVTNITYKESYKTLNDIIKAYNLIF